METSNRFVDFFRTFRQNKRAQLVLVVVLVVVVSAWAGYAVFGKAKPSTTNTNVTANTNTAPVQQARALDGEMVDAIKANPFPVAFMIENFTAARPQAGLDQADVVYEALAEGGITRFLAVFGFHGDVAKIGPIRSARPYYLSWAREYDALFVHAGGSPDALATIPQYHIRDLNQFYNNKYFFRDQDRLKKGIPSEHTLYTTGAKMTFALRDTNMPDHGLFTPWTFADDVPLDVRPVDPHTITIDFSSFSYKVRYTYDRATNTYLRSQAEQPHLMENGKQIAPKNVIVEYVPVSLVAGDEKGRLSMQTTGQGNAVIFHNGTQTLGTWQKDSPEARTVLKDASGNPMTLTTGKTWIEIVPPDHQITAT